MVIYDKHVKKPVDLIMSIASEARKDSHKVTLSYEECKDITEIIDVQHISCLDYHYLKEAFKNVSGEDMENYELYNIDFQEYKKDEISEVKLHRVDAGPYISGSSGVSSNRYSSDCDTYGSYYYSLYFLYQPEIKKYITVECKNYAC